MIMQTCACSKMSQTGTSICKALPKHCYVCNSPSTIVTTSQSSKQQRLVEKRIHERATAYTRRMMTSKILRLLRAQSFNQDNMTLIAKKVERHLYETSKSQQDYLNSKTLKHRVHAALSNLSEKARDEERVDDERIIDMDMYSQQQQLVRLYHSSKCPNQNCEDKCMETKQLWQHLAICKDSKCTVKNCFGSRKLLSHHLVCKSSSCSLCRPLKSLTTTTTP